MWKHPSTQRNIDTLKSDGVSIIEPGAGELASHLVGNGRLEEPENILKSIELYFACPQDLIGKKVLITAGPTYENIDPVRFIGNYSSGKMGFALAEECAKRGALVTIVTGPVGLKISNERINRIDVVSAKEMCEQCKEHFDECDIAILCAAVADYAPKDYYDSKIKREKTDTITIELVKNPDIAATLGKLKTQNQLLVGFALETDNERENAIRKIKNKNLDWIVLNSLKDKEAGFQKDTNKVTLLSVKGQEIPFEAKLKQEVAKDIIDTILNN